MAKITFIIGGARSGKSSYALSLCPVRAKKKVFLATAEPLDDEMAERIARHKQERDGQWQIIEEPVMLAAALGGVNGADYLLVDCLTLWVSNCMMRKIALPAMEKEIGAFFKQTEGVRGRVTIVANEVGLGIVPDNALARGFRDIAGRINRLVAARADKVFFMTAGIAMKVK